MDKPIPQFDVDELFDKAKEAQVPPFYLIYGWLCLNGYLHDEQKWNEAVIYNSRLGILCTNIELKASKNRERNVRVLKILDDMLGIWVSFDTSLEDELYADPDPDKYDKYIKYEGRYE